MTTDWPWMVGRMLTRRSKCLPWTVILMRPSWGRRFSAMSMLAHDLDARDHRGQQAARRAVAFDQDAVDAVADADAVGERLDVDVAGPQADRFLDDQVDQLDDRGVAVVADGRHARSASVSVKSICVSVNSGEHRVDRFGFASGRSAG